MPLTVRDRIGKSALTRGDVESHGSDRRFLTEALEPLGLDALRELRPAGGDDAAVEQHVHDVGREVLEDALVVRDEQEAELGPRRCGSR